MIKNPHGMTLKKFIYKYDKSGSIIFLEGKRIVKDLDKGKLTSLRKLLVIKYIKV